MGDDGLWGGAGSLTAATIIILDSILQAVPLSEPLELVTGCLPLGIKCQQDVAPSRVPAGRPPLGSRQHTVHDSDEINPPFPLSQSSKCRK